MSAPRVFALVGLAVLAFAADRLEAQDAPPAPPSPRAPQVTPAPPSRPAPPTTPAPPAPPAPPARQRLAFGFMLDFGPPLTVREVIPGSPAARAGIQEGDVLVSVDGRAATVASIREVGRRAAPGQEVRFRIRRSGREEVVTVVPAARPTALITPSPRHPEHIVIVDADSVQALVKLYLDGARETLELHGLEDLHFDFDFDEDAIKLGNFDWDSLGKALEELGPAIEKMTREMEGMTFDMRAPEIAISVEGIGFLPGARLSALEPDLAGYFPGAERGLLVLSVRPGSRSAQAGLEAGDVIVEIDGDPVEDLGDLRRALSPGNEPHELAVVRHGERRMITLSR